MKNRARIFILLGIVICAVIWTATSHSGETIEVDIREEGEEFGINELGMTYGSAAGVDKDPDLILAKGIDGTVGYIKSSDINPEFTSPEEALEWQANGGTPSEVPLYTEDGVTVIGMFKVG